MDVKEAIEKYENVKKIEGIYGNVDKDFFLEVVGTVLSELEKKDLLIKSMAKYIGEEDVTEIFCDGKEICDENCEKCVIDYFTKKCEGK